MKKRELRCAAFPLLSVVFLISFLASAEAQDAHLVCGQVNNAADSTDNGWREVRIYYAGSPSSYVWGQVSPQTDRYCISTIGIPGRSWVAGDTVVVEVPLQSDGYYAGPVSVATTAQGRDIAPEMTLAHLVDISSPLNITYNTSTITLKVHTRAELNNTISYSLDGAADIILCSGCNDVSATFTLADGSHFITVSASDALGNVVSHTVYFGIDTTPDDNIGEEKKEKYTKLERDKPILFRISSDEETRGIVEIAVYPISEVKDVELISKELKGKPRNVKRAPGVVYKYHEINAIKLMAKDIGKAVITLRVEQSWLESNNLNKENLVLSRFNEETNQWEDLPTTIANENDKFAFYEAETPGFSFFAIRVPARGGYTEIRTSFFVFILLTILIALYIVYSIVLSRRKRQFKTHIKVQPKAQGQRHR